METVKTVWWSGLLLASRGRGRVPGLRLTDAGPRTLATPDHRADTARTELFLMRPVRLRKPPKTG